MTEQGTKTTPSAQRLYDRAMWLFGTATLRTFALTPIVLALWVFVGGTVVYAGLDRDPPFDTTTAAPVLMAAILWPVLLRVATWIMGYRVGVVDLSPNYAMSPTEAKVRRRLWAVIWGGTPVVGAVAGLMVARGGISEHLWALGLGALGLPIVLGVPLYLVALIVVMVGSGFRIRPVCDRVMVA